MKIVFVHHFWTLSETNLAFCQNLPDGVVQTAFYVSWGTFQLAFFLEIIFFLSFLENERKRFDFLSEIRKKVCQNCIPGVHMNYLRENILWRIIFSSVSELDQIFLSNLAKFLCQGCEHGILHVNRKFWDEKFLWKKKVVLISLLDIQQKNSGFFQTCSAGMSKMHSTCP